jgi:hypothetical protein
MIEINKQEVLLQILPVLKTTEGVEALKRKKR